MNLPADLVLRGGHVTTRIGGPVASAVAVNGEHVSAVGDKLDHLIGPDTHVVELEGRHVLPGINDAHLHLQMFGLSRPPFAVALGEATSFDEAAGLIRAEHLQLPPDRWLKVTGFRQNALADMGNGGLVPHRHLLDEIAGDRPTVVRDASEHRTWANTAALRRAGVDQTTSDPAGGHLERDANGPTGVLVENAQGLVLDVLPAPSQSARLDALEEAMRHLNRLGVTSATDALVWPELLEDYRQLRQQGRVTVRMNLLVHWAYPTAMSTSLADAEAGLKRHPSAAEDDDWVRVGGLKLLADGVPSHRTAWMHRPYDGGTCCGAPLGAGAGTSDADAEAEFREVVRRAHSHRLQVQVHVTGDRAADSVVDTFIAVQRDDPWPDARHALIHGTLLAPPILRRLADHGIGVISSSLMRRHSGLGIEAAVGPDRWLRAFPIADLLRHGVRVADSSDAPVTPPDWRKGVATLGGAPGPWSVSTVPESLHVRRDDALRLWTSVPAWFERTEDRKGFLEPGALADLVVLGGDPWTCPPDGLEEMPVLLTMVGGDIVHAA